MTNRAGVVPLVRLSVAGSAYTYAIPEPLHGSLQRGQHVEIPFRERTVAGIVVDLNGVVDMPRVRDIIAISDPEPVLLPHQLDLAAWIAYEYRAPLSDVLSGMLPPSLKRAHPDRDGDDRTFVLTPDGRAARATGSHRRSDAQDSLLAQLDADGPMPVRQLLARTGTRLSSLTALERAGLVRPEEHGTATSAMPEPAARPALSDAQANAAEAILGSMSAAPAAYSTERETGNSPVFLLHGVTGSGKTEVYMAVIEEALRRGADAIVMVPEISLTPQALRRFTGRFPGLVATIHSRLSDRERRSEWRRLRSGQARIAVGPRSALFAPLRNIGVIVVDEEHDASYKQGESPRYHARAAAIQLGRMLRIPIILGSATPDASSYFLARNGHYRMLTLPDRPVWAAPGPDHPAIILGQRHSAPASRGVPGPLASRCLPPVQIVDLRQELKAGNRGIFSRALRKALCQTFEAEHQAMLLLNRRGSATSVVCRSCGYVARCEKCEIPLTFHSTNLALICHRCALRRPPPRRCPQCGGNCIRYLGIGTQRVVDEVRALLPAARVLRWDRDVTSKQGAHENLAAQFEGHHADILVGTQMIAKGHDFPLVTLVGVIVADLGLNLPDFRAAERVFQLMTQMAGRAGRAELPSRVIIQAYNPEHYAVQAAKSHDYWGFYRQEMVFRHALGYPPYRRLTRLILRGRSNAQVEQRALGLRQELLRVISARGFDSIRLFGPAPAFVARVNTVYRWQMLLFGDHMHSILDVVPDDVIVDIDPVDLL